MQRMIARYSTILALMCGGCFDGNVACTDMFAYGVNVTLTDADTGEPVTGATLTLTEGDYTEVMDELEEGSFAGAGERAGTYSLVVEVAGFETVTIGDITVDEDECHVIPVSRAIELTATQPNPAGATAP